MSCGERPPRACARAQVNKRRIANWPSVRLAEAERDVVSDLIVKAAQARD